MTSIEQRRSPSRSARTSRRFWSGQRLQSDVEPAEPQRSCAGPAVVGVAPRLEDVLGRIPSQRMMTVISQRRPFVALTKSNGSDLPAPPPVWIGLADRRSVVPQDGTRRRAGGGVGDGIAPCPVEIWISGHRRVARHRDGRAVGDPGLIPIRVEVDQAFEHRPPLDCGERVLEPLRLAVRIDRVFLHAVLSRHQRFAVRYGEIVERSGRSGRTTSTRNRVARGAQLYPSAPMMSTYASPG